MKTSILRLAQKHQKVIMALGSLLIAVMLFVVVSAAINIPTVYVSYSTRKVEKVVASDGTVMPNVLPKGSYDTVWTH